MTHPMTHQHRPSRDELLALGFADTPYHKVFAGDLDWIPKLPTGLDRQLDSMLASPPLLERLPTETERYMRPPRLPARSVQEAVRGRKDPVDRKRHGDPELLRRFPREILRLEAEEWRKERKARIVGLSKKQLTEVAALRRRERGCVHAARARMKRIENQGRANHTTEALLKENSGLRLEKERLQKELAAVKSAA